MPGQTCRQAHLYGGYQAERFGGSYIYFCPINMLHWASPLKEEGMMTGALIAGPALIIDPDELIDELNQKFDAESVRKANLKNRLEDIPDSAQNRPRPCLKCFL